MRTHEESMVAAIRGTIEPDELTAAQRELLDEAERTPEDRGLPEYQAVKLRRLYEEVRSQMATDGELHHGGTEDTESMEDSSEP